MILNSDKEFVPSCKVKSFNQNAIQILIDPHMNNISQ
jgi:hypothetical protein